MAAKKPNKSQFIAELVDRLKVTTKEAKIVSEEIANIVTENLKKHGLAIIPDVVKLFLVKKPATKERPGINPFTKQPITIKAKPARKAVRARPASALKKALA
jgi:nucleoid DNA-binding protein